MKKNVASQRIGAQLVSASDGSAFTGSVTVSVTGDAGTQATGSVGSGACTHEGNGYHTYAPAQAETNYDLIAFTFTGSGAVPVTVQVFTRPTTGLLAPTVDGRTLDVSSGGEAGLDWANVGSPTTTLNLSGTTIKTATDVETDTADIQARIPAALVSGRIDASVGAMASGVVTAASISASALDGKGNWNIGKTGYALTYDIAAAFTSLGTAVADVPTVSEFEARTILAASYATATEVAKVIKTGEEFTATDGTGTKDVTFTRI